MMHARGSICHGDLKLSNILVADSGQQADNKELFLCDFCSSGTLGEEFPFLHTSYPAPELMNTSCKIYTPSIDLWCLGVLLFRLKYDSQEQRQMVRQYFSHAALKRNQKIYQEGIRQVHEVCKKSIEIGKGNAEYIRGYDQAIIELLSVDPRNRPPASVIWHMLDKDNPNYDQKSA
jgi:serine/threonine protein kinase